MVRQEAVALVLITAMVLISMVAVSTANVSYSYELTTNGGSIIADDEHTSLSLENSTANQYSLHVDAMNALNGSCNHSLVEEGDTIRSETNITYQRKTTGDLPVLINGKPVCGMGGARVTENIGSASSETVDDNASFYEGAIGFTTEVNSLKLSSGGKSYYGSESYYNITAKGKGKFTAGLGSITILKRSTNHNWRLLAKKVTRSRVGVKAGEYNFVAHYYVSRS